MPAAWNTAMFIYVYFVQLRGYVTIELANKKAHTRVKTYFPT